LSAAIDHASAEGASMTFAMVMTRSSRHALAPIEEPRESLSEIEARGFIFHTSG